MDLDSPRPEAHSHQVDPANACLRRDSRHVGSFDGIDGVDRVVTGGDAAHLYGDTAATVGHDEIDLATGNNDIASQLDEPPAGEPKCREPLTRRAQGCAALAQSLSSVFSNFSTFTSRKVSTWTCSRNRAGRNMSHTHASLMTTSK